MLKISNETKVGALAALSITILVLGYNFLSGRDSIWSSGKTYHAKFNDLKGLEKSNPIMYRGYRIGQVGEILMDKSGQFFDVALDIQKDIKITEGSVASIGDKDFFGSKAIVFSIKQGAKELEDGSFLTGDAEASLVESLGTTLGPIATRIDSLVAALNGTINSGAFQGTIANLEVTTKNLKGVSGKIDQMMIDNQEKLNAIFINVESITSNLKNNNAVINKILSNVDSITYKVKNLELQKTVKEANAAIANFNSILNNVQNGDGTLSLLLKDPKLYNDLDKVSKDLDALIIDINKYPKRYFSIGSGKKADKERDKDIGDGSYVPTTK